MTDSDSTENERIDLPNDTLVYGNDKIQIGIDEHGNGFIEYQTRSVDSYRFSVPIDEIEEFVEIQSANGPPVPTRPEDVIADDEIIVPDGWTGGNVEHTGGNIWLRIFRKKRPGSGYIEVSYDPIPEIKGVQAGAYDEEGAWIGEIDHEPLSGDPMEQQAVEAARDLMERINNGEYYYRIQDLYE